MAAEAAARNTNPLLRHDDGAGARDDGGEDDDDDVDAGDFSIKQKWFEETVFRNQAQAVPKQGERQFINDPTRNTFHKDFMDRFIK